MENEKDAAELVDGTVCGLVDELASGFVTGMMKEWTGGGWA